MNRFIGKDGSIQTRIRQIVDGDLRLTPPSYTKTFGVRLLAEGKVAGVGERAISLREREGDPNGAHFICGTSRMGGSHVVI